MADGQPRRDSAIFSSVGSVAVVVASGGSLHPPKFIASSHGVLTLSYYSIITLLFLLALLLFSLAFALSVVREQRAAAVRGAARKVVVATLMLLLLVMSFAAYGLLVAVPGRPATN